ncbi:MAG: HAD family hydrolase [Actinomycetota bacterium]
MSERWLIGLDVDGTILLADETLSPGVRSAVARVRDAGHEVTIATGRSWGATAHIVEMLDISPAYVVCSNGAVTMRRLDDGSYVRDHIETFDPTAALQLLNERLPDARYMVELGDGKRLFTHEMGDWSLDEGRQVEFDELSALPVSRVVVISPGHDEDDFHHLVADAGLNEVSYAIGWTAWLDIAPHGVDKGTAMERVRTTLGFPGERVLVAGDGRNDIGMFEWVGALGGRGVSMGQAPDEVTAAATERTADVHDGGLAHVLDALADATTGIASAAGE